MKTFILDQLNLLKKGLLMRAKKETCHYQHLSQNVLTNICPNDKIMYIDNLLTILNSYNFTVETVKKSGERNIVIGIHKNIKTFIEIEKDTNNIYYIEVKMINKNATFIASTKDYTSNLLRIKSLLIITGLKFCNEQFILLNNKWYEDEEDRN